MFKWDCNRYLATLLPCYLLIVSSAFAMGGSDSSYYAGAMLGPTTSATSSSSSSTSKTSAGARFFVGYEANQNFSYEGGLSFYPQSTSSEGCTAQNQRKIYFDLVLKGTLMFSETIGIYSKLGPATNIYLPGLNSCGEGTATKIYPTMSVGTSLGLTGNAVLDVSWNRLILGGTAKYIQLYGVGLSYHFML